MLSGVDIVYIIIHKIQASITAIFIGSEPFPKDYLPIEKETLSINDFSISRKVQPAPIRPFVWLYYRIAYVLRYEGFRSLLIRTKSFLFRK